MAEAILGILGGMGPYAALEFNRKILEKTPARKDWEHIHTILDNDVRIPSRTRHILYHEADPVPAIISGIERLARAGACAVVLPCNSVHYFYGRVAPEISVPWLNMLQAVADRIRTSGGRRTLVLGGYVTVTKKTYDPYLPGTVYLDEKGNSLVYDLIESAKLDEKERMEETAVKLVGYMEHYRKLEKIDSVLFGCTELALSDTLAAYRGVPVFDSNDIYAEYAVDFVRKREGQ
ncbi:amino acid racemase [Hydrogenimonas sp. SS33]|uniref:aspartate/glutamate racemase family protein n=1 Tax=Hydrogenimonas leucolamina TaxID=2954236 RepID=UPI00336C1EE5